MDKKTIQEIIEAGNLASSGGNSQPWRFMVKDESILVVALPEKDHRVLNFRSRGTYVAHGALMENMEVASRAFGYEPKFDLFPGENISAKVTFRPLAAQANGAGLYGEVPRRHSNRKSYAAAPLPEADKAFLLEAVEKFPQCELAIVEGEKIRRAAEQLAFDVLINMRNRLLHDLLFKEVLWHEEEQKSRSGLYVKTMEIAPPKTFIFKLLKNWSAVRLLNRLNILQKIYEENVKTISSAGLLGAIAVRHNDADFIYAGRLAENIWLRAAKLNLGFHLMTGILFLWQQANYGDAQIFSKGEKAIIDKGYHGLKDIFGGTDKIITLAFRVGRADPPTAVSYKRPAEIGWE